MFPVTLFPHPQDIQDAISALYYILSRHGSAMATGDTANMAAAACAPSTMNSVAGSSLSTDENAAAAAAGVSGTTATDEGVRAAAAQEGRAALVTAARAMLQALQGRALVREAMASAASVLWVTALAPGLPPPAVAAVFATGLFLSPEQTSQGASIQWTGPDVGHNSPPAAGASAAALPGCSGASDPYRGLGVVDEGLRAAGGRGLVQELQRLSAVGKLCGLKGLATVLPLRDVLCSPLRLTWAPVAGAESGAAAAAAEAEATQAQGSAGECVFLAARLDVSGGACPTRCCCIVCNRLGSQHTPLPRQISSNGPL